MTNCILWGDTGGEIHVYGSSPAVTYCNIQGGWVGAGNINVDPCFVSLRNGDYHLRSEAGRWDPNQSQWVTDANTSLCIDAGDPNSDWTVELWPHGKRINMGAHGGTPQASMSLSGTGNMADLTLDGVTNFQDFCYLADSWKAAEALLAEDFDRNGVVDFNDLRILAENWLWKE
jgi:hypothetical protein